MTQSPEPAVISIRRHLLAGAAAVFLLVGGVGGWAATTDISGAVIAPGLLVVDSNVKTIQHQSGGTVGEILVKDGDRVKSGDVVMRLDETKTRAGLQIVVKQLDELNARQARLRAERDGLAEIEFPDELSSRKDNPEVALIIEGERKLMDLRTKAREGQRSQLNERIAQLKEEISGLTEQETAKGREMELIEGELKGIRQLAAKNLVPIARVNELERTAARLGGERGQYTASRAQARGKITETELQILGIDQELRSEVARELRDIEAKIAELRERKVAAEDELQRIDIRAPQDGIVHQLAVHTIGGVIRPGDTIMLIVPDADDLAVEARVAPQDIDQLHAGQEAVLRMSAFDQQTTPEIHGTVARVSPDQIEDPKTGLRYYTTRIELKPEEVARLGELKLLPGMPVEAFIKTRDRTVLSFLVKPLTDQIRRAFREG